MRTLICTGALALVLFPLPLWAQTPPAKVVAACGSAQGLPAGNPGPLTVDVNGTLCSSVSGAVAVSNGSINVVPQTRTGGFTGVTVGVASALALAVRSGPQYFLMLSNESTTATIACAFGATAALNTAGSFTLAPAQKIQWSANYVPLDAINCIASAAASPLTVEAN